MSGSIDTDDLGRSPEAARRVTHRDMPASRRIEIIIDVLDSCEPQKWNAAKKLRRGPKIGGSSLLSKIVLFAW
jgi:hypothetical protein